MRKLYLRKFAIARVLSFFAVLFVSINSNAQVQVAGSTGADATYTTLKAAFDALNLNTNQTGNTISITITASTTEAASAVLSKPSAGNWTSLLITSVGSNTVSGALAAPLVDLNGVSNVTINGTSSGGTLTLSNTSATSTTNTSTIRLYNDATNNTITNCTISGSSTSTTLGTILIGAGVTTGNTGNTISNNTINAAGSNLPVNGIYSAGTSATVFNSGTISGNNISDYFSATLATAGIYLSSTGNSAWTISNNKLFQSATRVYTTANTHYGIFVGTGAGYTISGNTIGYANTSGTGTTNMVGSASAIAGFPASYSAATGNATRYVAISAAFTAAGTNSLIQGNTVGGFALYTSSGATTTNGIWCGINVTSGNVTVGGASAGLGNTIGATSGTSSVYAASTTTGAQVVGIYTTSANTVTIQNNTVGAIDAVGTTATLTAGVTAIDAAGAANYTISNNTVGNTTPDNIRAGYTLSGASLSNAGTLTSSTGGTSVMVGIRSTATGNTVTISNNVLRGWATSGTAIAVTGITSSGTMTGTTPAATVNGNSVGTSSTDWIRFAVANSGTLTGISLTNTVATTHSIQNNDIRGITYSVAGSGANTYINLTGATAANNVATVANNTFTNLNVNTTGSVVFISHSYLIATTGQCIINNNSIVTGFNKLGAGGTNYIMYTNSSSNSGSSNTYTNNNFSNITLTGATPLNGLHNTDGGTGSVKTITGNTFNNWTGGTSALIPINVTYFGSGTSSISTNTVSNISGQGAITGINIGSTANNATLVTIANNNVFNLTSTGAGGNVTGITSSNTSTTVTLSGNTIYGLTSTLATGTVTALGVTGGTTVNVSGNTLYGVAASASNNVNGISVSGGTTVNVSGNQVYNFSSSSTSPVVSGVAVSGGTTVNVYKNKVYGLTASAAFTTNGGVLGLSLTGGATVNAYNNLVGLLTAPTANTGDAIRGVSVTSTTASTTYRVYFNTIYLNATSTGTNFGTTGVYHTASGTATTAALDLQNNILINLSTPAGTGIVSVLRRSAAATLGNFATTSNRNLLYAGTPGAANVIMYDGTNSYQQFATDYKTAVGSRDASSFTGEASFDYTAVSPASNAFFQSLTGSATTFLHLVNGITTQVESGAAAIATPAITDDYDGDARNATKPDIGADEFTGVTPSPTISVNTPTNNCNAAVAHTITATVNTPVGTITAVSITYDNGSSTTVAMNYVSGSGTGPYVYTYDIPAATPASKLVTWSVSATNSVSVQTTVGGTAYQDMPLTGYTASASASTTSVCAGSNTTLTAKLVTLGSGSATVGAGGTTTTTTGSPFYHGWGGSQTQYIITAAELSAAGLTAGPVTSLGLDVVSIGTGTFTGFAISMGLTSQSTFATANAITTGVNQVYQGTGTGNAVTLTAGINTFPLTGFTWDGTSNIVVKFCWSNANTGGTTAYVKTDAYTTNVGMYIYADNQTVATVCGATTTIPASGGSSTTLQRPKFILSGTVELPKAFTTVWSDGTSTVGSTNPLTIAVPAATTYTATLTASGCPIQTNGVTISMNPGLAPGTYSIGTGSIAGEAGHYATLTAAVADYNSKCLSGAVTFALTDATYSSNETFPIVITANSSASATNTLTIKPNTGVTASISGTSTSAIIKLNGADYVTIDGSNNGSTSRNLTIANTNTGTSSSVVWIASASASDVASNVTVKNAIVTGNATTTTLAAVFVGGTTTVGSNAAAANTNITIQNNKISMAQIGLAVYGTSTSVLDNNLLVANNTMGSSSAGDGFSISGIAVAFQNNATISGNDVQNLTNTGSLGLSDLASQTINVGIYVKNSTNTLLSANAVHYMNIGGSSVIRNYGISIESPAFNVVGTPSNNRVINNLVYDLRYSGSGSSTWQLSGINDNGGYGDKFYYNSVSLTGAFTSTSGPNAAFSNGNAGNSAAASAIDVRNNIFYVNITAAGASSSYFAHYNKLSSATGSTFNYNTLSTTVASGNGTAYTGLLSSTNYSTLANWQTITTQEAQSKNGDPTFNSATDLRIQTGSPAAAAGTPIAGVTTDYAGTTRSGTAPNMGAYETLLPDVTPPTITYTALAGTCVVADRTLTAVIADGNGVETTASLVPRIYYKRGTGGTWFSQPGTLTSGDAKSGTWSFTIVAADMVGLTGGDQVYYYVVAQDIAATPNVASSPAGVTATNVNSITTPPTTPANYLIQTTMAGTFNVGAGQTSPNFATLTAAISAYNNSCLTGAVTLNLVDATYGASETFPIVINANSNASATNTLKIKPATGNTATITGSAASDGLIKLNGADYVTIDGSNAGASDRSLTISNLSGTTPTGIALVSAGTAAGATFNTIKNVNITTTANAGYGISVGGSAGSSGADNDNTTIQNNSISGVSVGVYAIGTGTGVNDNLTIANNRISVTSGISGSYGIQVGQGTGGSVAGNTISVYTTASGAPAGISIETGFVSASVSKNKITQVYTEGTGGYGGRGITVGTGTASSNLTIDNNVIYGVNAASNWTSFGNSSSMGIAIGTIGNSSTLSTTTGGIKLYYNSVNMFGNHLWDGASITTALYIGSGASALDIRNNVFVNSLVNTSTSGTGSKNYGVYSAAAASAFTTIDRNLYYGTNSSNSTFVVGFLGSDQATLSAWAAATSQDANSKSADPVFNSNTVLMPKAGSPTLASGAVLSVTTDFLGVTRSGTAPTIGAYENAGDGAAPVITYTALPFTCSTTDRTLSGVTITDESGVPTTGSLVPRIYYRKGTGTWYSQPGTRTAGTATNGTWSFTIVAADMGGITAGDQVSYYLIAQDVASTPNIESSPAGVTAVDVNTITTAPSTVNAFAVNANLGGVYSVGAGAVSGEVGHYGTLTAAIAAYNVACLTTAVTFTLTDAGYNSNETFPLVIKANPYASATNTLTIKPNSNTDVLIQAPTTNTNAAIKLNGADYVILDGIHDAAGTNLTIENKSTTSGNAVVWLASTGAGNGATNNVIKNVTLKGGNDQSTGTPITTYGVVIAGSSLSGTITSVTAGDDNDNNTIDTCTFLKLRYAIYSRGGSTTNPNLGTVIKRNVVGPTGFGTDEIGKAGIVVREEDGIQIKNNEVRFVGGDYANNPAASAIARAGIALATDATWTPTAVLVKNAVVSANTVHDIQDEKTGAAIGIIVAAVDGTNTTGNVVASNFVYNIKANGTTSPNQAVGIGVSSGKGDKVSFNSINMTGNVAASASATTPTVSNFGIRVTSSNASNLSIVNNNVVMDLTGGGALLNFCIDLPASYSFGTDSMNYNNWYANLANSQSRTGSFNNGAVATQFTNLAAWQTATSQDSRSKEVDPIFVSPTDLHLQASSPLDGQATPLPYVTTDIDNQTRSATTPDIGADELPASAGLDLKPLALTGPAIAAKGCYNNEAITVNIQNNGAGIVNFSGSPVTVSVAVSGSITANYTKTINTGTLAAGAILPVTLSTAGTLLDMSTPGVYVFDISTSVSGDVNTANDAVQEFRTKEVLTVGSVTATPSEYCAVGGKPVLTTSGANGYTGLQWQSTNDLSQPFTDIAGATGTTYTAASNITSNMFYKLIATCGANTDESVTPVVINNPAPVTTTGATRCGTGTVQLQATANSGDVLYWYSAATGGSVIGQGPTFTTAPISATTDFYVAAASGSDVITAMGAGASTGTAAPYNPLNGGYGGAKGQYIFRASELNAAGFTAGRIDTLALDLTTAGATLNGFNIQVGTTSLTDFPSANIQGGLTTVYSGTFVPVVGLNKFALSSPFNWDGSSNLIVSFSWSNNNTSNTSSTVKYDAMTYNATQMYRKDNETAANMLAFTGSTGTGTFTFAVSVNRPRVVFSRGACQGTRVAVTATVTAPPALTSVSATPATVCAGQSSTLNVTSGNSNYTYNWSPGGSGASISVSPSTTTAYTVTATDAGTGCVNTGNVTLTVNPVPSAVTISPASVSICPGSPAQLLTITGGSLANTATVSSGTISLTIPDVSATGISNTAAVSGIPAGSTVDSVVVTLNITHGFDQDVVVNLEAPNGQIVNLISGQSITTGTNFTNTRVSSNSAMPALSSGAAPFTGTYKADLATSFQLAPSPLPTTTTFSDLFTVPNGNWKIRAYDDESIGTGTLKDWTITVFYSAPVNQVWSPTTGLYTDAAGTIPYTGTSTSTVYANPAAASSTYTATASSAAGCYSNNTVTVTKNSTISSSTVLAGTQGGAQVCSSYDVAVSNTYFNNCDLIATVTPNGGAAVSGVINSCVKIDNTVLTAANGQPYVQRHFDITPATNATTATSRITLYFKQAEFTSYNTSRGTYPALPTGAADASGIANLRVTQFNGTGSAPGNYTGTPVVIDPADADITYDATADRWSVSFDVTGSGGFYVHTANWILPVTIVSFKGENAGNINKLFWTTSTEANSKGFELERSADGTRFTKVDFISTKANGGNSSTALNYAYDDVKPLVGANYYRLKQIDNDGKYNYSNVVLLNRKVTEITLAKVFPNPASKELTVQIVSPRSEKLTLVVTDLSGKIVMHQPANVVLGDNQQQLQIGALAGGTYVIKAVCANGCETSVLRFVKQ